jgi:hypothetical protein
VERVVGLMSVRCVCREGREGHRGAHYPHEPGEDEIGDGEPVPLGVSEEPVPMRIVRGCV